MSRPIELTCPDPQCRWQWTIDYQTLQAYKVIHRGTNDTGRRVETYNVPCPNPAHGEMVIVTLEISGGRP